MFWKKKDKAAKTPEPVQMTRDQIIAQAKANAAAARAEIGDVTLEKIKAAMLKKQASALEQAKAKIKTMDDDKVRDSLRLWIRDKD